MKNIFNVLIVVILVLTVYNTYKIHMTSAPENTSQSAFAESINTNAAEIQTLKDNQPLQIYLQQINGPGEKM